MFNNLIPLLGLATLVALAGLILIRPLRRSIITRPIFSTYRKVLPQMSDTERDALEAGTVWWEGELFRGAPDWQKLHAYPQPKLTPAEQSFLDNECEEACRLVNDWQVTQELYDLPADAWRYIKDKGFLGMIIPKKYGGLEFSAYAHSQVVTKLSTRSSALSVSVMVPNSPGPAELLNAYGPALAEKTLQNVVLHQLRPQDLALPDAMGLQPESITVTPRGLAISFHSKPLR